MTKTAERDIIFWKGMWAIAFIGMMIMIFLAIVDATLNHSLQGNIQIVNAKCMETLTDCRDTLDRCMNTLKMANYLITECYK